MACVINFKPAFKNICLHPFRLHHLVLFKLILTSGVSQLIMTSYDNRHYIFLKKHEYAGEKQADALLLSYVYTFVKSDIYTTISLKFINLPIIVLFYCGCVDMLHYILEFCFLIRSNKACHRLITHTSSCVLLCRFVFK